MEGDGNLMRGILYLLRLSHVGCPGLGWIGCPVEVHKLNLSCSLVNWINFSLTLHHGVAPKLHLFEHTQPSSVGLRSLPSWLLGNQSHITGCREKCTHLTHIYLTTNSIVGEAKMFNMVTNKTFIWTLKAIQKEWNMTLISFSNNLVYILHSLS